MQRARRTAELAGLSNPQLTDLLREVDYGDYEGLTSEQIHESNPSWEIYADGAAWIHADLGVATGLMLDVATLCVLRDDGHRLINLWNSQP
jgi:broad specificity phosphatase PhoE